MKYTELQVTTNFSFLRGASHPEELVEQAAALGYAAVGITDRNTLAGIVRAHVAAKKAGIRLIVGCRLDLQDGPSLLAYPMNKSGYARLSNLLGKPINAFVSSSTFMRCLSSGFRPCSLIPFTSKPSSPNSHLSADKRLITSVDKPIAFPTSLMAPL